MRSKQLSSVSVRHTKCLPGFLVMVNQFLIYDSSIKKNCIYKVLSSDFFFFIEETKVFVMRQKKICYPNFLLKSFSALLTHIEHVRLIKCFLFIGCVSQHLNPCWLFNAKSWFFVYTLNTYDL